MLDQLPEELKKAIEPFVEIVTRDFILRTTIHHYEDDLEFLLKMHESIREQVGYIKDFISKIEDPNHPLLLVPEEALKRSEELYEYISLLIASTPSQEKH